MPCQVPSCTAEALLGSDEALLVYLTADEATWLWVLRRDDLAYYCIELGAKALADEVTALRASLDPALNPDRVPFPASRAYAVNFLVTMKKRDRSSHAIAEPLWGCPSRSIRAPIRLHAGARPCRPPARRPEFSPAHEYGSAVPVRCCRCRLDGAYGTKASRRDPRR
jgi:hypothetical protein